MTALHLTSNLQYTSEPNLQASPLFRNSIEGTGATDPCGQLLV